MILRGKTALVTGGARRLGRAICLELIRAGADVAVHYRSSRNDARSLETQIAELGGRCVLIEADLEEPKAWQRVISACVAAFGRLDILVNNAAMFAKDAAASGEVFGVSAWDRTIRVNLTAPVALAHLARPHLSANGPGRIINLTDISASHPWPNYQAYCAAKAGLECTTKALARQFAPQVLVNALALGVVEINEGCSDDEAAKLISKIPLGRRGTADELARLIRALLEHGDYLTGTVIPFDGGRSLA